MIDKNASYKLWEMEPMVMKKKAVPVNREVAQAKSRTPTPAQPISARQPKETKPVALKSALAAPRTLDISPKEATRIEVSEAKSSRQKSIRKTSSETESAATTIKNPLRN